MSKYKVIYGPYFPAFGLNTERYGASLSIQSEYRKIQSRNNSVFGHFLRRANTTQRRKSLRFLILNRWNFQKKQKLLYLKRCEVFMEPAIINAITISYPREKFMNFQRSINIYETICRYALYDGYRQH